MAHGCGYERLSQTPSRTKAEDGLVNTGDTSLRPDVHLFKAAHGVASTACVTPPQHTHLARPAGEEGGVKTGL